jgi:acylphosphatase
VSREIDGPSMPPGAARVEAADMVALRLQITGRVQGVGYRDWLVAAAQRLRLFGWVRNRWDGSVEAHAQGERALVERLVGQCRDGPLVAKVAAVEVSPAQPEDLTDFHRRSTG